MYTEGKPTVLTTTFVLAGCVAHTVNPNGQGYDLKMTGTITDSATIEGAYHVPTSETSQLDSADFSSDGTVLLGDPPITYDSDACPFSIRRTKTADTRLKIEGSDCGPEGGIVYYEDPAQ